MPFDPSFFLTLQKSNIQADDIQGQQLSTLKRDLFGGVVPVMQIDTDGKCIYDAGQDGNMKVFASSTDSTLGSSCSLFASGAATERCTNTCYNAKNDNECDDGGPGAKYSNCALGTDCNDCGMRYNVKEWGSLTR